MERDEGTPRGGIRTAGEAACGTRAALERLPPHEHVCLFYEREDEWASVLLPYLRAGLERGHKCVWIYDRIPPDEIRSRSGLEAAAIEACEALGRLILRPSTEAYLAGGAFQPRTMVEFLGHLVDEAVAQGYPLIRYVGEANWAGSGGAQYVRGLLEYEATLNEEFFPYRPFSAVCLYDRRLFNPDVLRGVMMTHPRVIWRERLYSNPFYLPPGRFLALVRAGGGSNAFGADLLPGGEGSPLSEICAEPPGFPPWEVNLPPPAG